MFRYLGQSRGRVIEKQAQVAWLPASSVLSGVANKLSGEDGKGRRGRKVKESCVVPGLSTVVRRSGI